MPRYDTGLERSMRLRRRDDDNGMRLAVMLMIISLVLFTLSGREAGTGLLSTIRGGFQVLTMPVRYMSSLVVVPFQGFGNVLANLTSDQETLSDLRERNEELAARNVELEEAQKTAERLQDLLDLQDTYNLQSTAARIISGSTDSWSSTVTIDKGTISGISVGMPVTDSTGVIGQTISCGLTSSTVLLITDESSSVSAMLQQSRVQGMLKGSADGTLHLTLIDSSQTVETGDVIVTSGLGGVFPKGLLLGTVSNVSKTTGALYLDIEVKEQSSPENYEEVLVITSLTESQQATSDDIAAADAQDSESLSISEDQAGSADTEGTQEEASSADESDEQDELSDEEPESATDGEG